MTTSTNKLTWTRMNTEPSPSSHLTSPSSSLFLFALISFLLSLHVLHTYHHPSPLSSCLFLSLSLVYLFVISPCPSAAHLHTIHNYSASSFAAPPCLHLHGNNNSNVRHIPVISAWVTQKSSRAWHGDWYGERWIKVCKYYWHFDFRENNVFAHYGVLYLPLVRC